MKKKALPIGTIFIILVITLALLGVGYALWSETLTITGNVETGEVDVGLIVDPVEECVDVNGELCVEEPTEKADAADCTLEEDPLGDPDGDGVSELVVSITGMYPSYHCKVSFKVESLGNVPVHVWLPEATGDIPEWVATDFDECYDNGVQLHQGEETDPCTMDIHFSNEQAPEENSGPYTFSWTILATQWNEDPYLYVLSDQLNYNGSGGWGGWSCPLDYTVVAGGYLPATADVAVSMAWKPGATVGIYSYPTTPFGYSYAVGEEGWIVQDGGNPLSKPDHIFVWCLPPE
jgi:hypothetical protein